jgi:hypothetical protein
MPLDKTLQMSIEFPALPVEIQSVTGRAGNLFGMYTGF